jgi:hypothetical protein
VKDSDDAEDADGEVGERGEGLREVKAVEFDYLLTMRISSLTVEKVDKIKGELVEKETQLIKIQKTTIEALWLSDLDQFIEKLDQIEAKQERDWAEEDKLEKAPKQGKLVGKKKKTTEKNNRNVKDKAPNPFKDKVRYRKPQKTAPSGMKGKDYDSDSAEEPRVIKKPLSSRQKRPETSAIPNKAPTQDSIVMMEEKISSKEMFQNYLDNNCGNTPDHNCDFSPSFRIDDHSPIKRIKGNEPILRSIPTKNLEYDSDPGEQSKDSDYSDGWHSLMRQHREPNKKLPCSPKDFVPIVGEQSENSSSQSAEDTTEDFFRNPLPNPGSPIFYDRFLAKSESLSENEVDF